MRLITPVRVIELSFSNHTDETSFIKDFVIEAAQLRWIKPMLGEDLWDLLETESDAGSYSTANQTLVTKLEKPLAFFVKHELIPDMSINTTSSGLQVITTEYSSPATDKQRGEIQDMALTHAKTLLDEITRWIEKPANITSYPTYSTSVQSSKSISRNAGLFF